MLQQYFLWHPNRRNGERNIERCLVLMHPNGVEVFDSLALLDSFDDGRFFVSTIDRNNQRDVLAHRFTGRITKYPLRTSVPTGYDAFQRLANDGILTGVHDCGEQADSFIRFEA